jgi:hypothetical protein
VFMVMFRWLSLVHIIHFLYVFMLMFRVVLFCRHHPFLLYVFMMLFA